MAEPAFVPDFPVSEFAQRLERAQRPIIANQLDALLVTTEAGVAESPKKDDAAMPGMPPGGMGGMDMM